MNQSLRHHLLYDMAPDLPTAQFVADSGCIGRAMSMSPEYRVSQRGFTIIELILVIVMMGVLSVFVAPTFNSTDFNARGLHDQTLALLRYAQKSAIAKRRTVCVAFTATSVSLTVASLSTTTLTCDTALDGAGGSSTVTARSGVQFSSFPAAGFSFDALGAPSAAQSIQASNNVTSAIVVEAVTGYVHD